MNISKALKTKNRLAGELARARTIFARENSHRENEVQQSNPAELLKAVDDAQESLIKIKTAIAVASAPISEKLVRMGELKGRIAWLNGLTIREGVHRDRFAGDKADVEHWVSHLKTVDRDKEVEALQKAINDLQDEVDEFNAVTKIAL